MALQISIRCIELLDSCHFAEFWTALASLAAVTSDPSVAAVISSNHAKRSLRRSIIKTLSLTYKSVSVCHIGLSTLSFDSESELVDFVKGDEVVSDIVEAVSDGKILFVPRVENSVINKVFQEGVDYVAIHGLVSKTSAVSCAE